MQVESLHLSPIEKELRFNNWRRNNNIQLFLLDLDDTICDTMPVFTQQISKACQFLSTNYPLLTTEDWQKEIKSINDILFEQYGVNPHRWNQMVDTLEKKYLLHSETSNQIKEIFQIIYTTPLQFKSGAKEGLNFFKKTNTPLAIVTQFSLSYSNYLCNWILFIVSYK